jgi:general secretion pathway protein D
VVVRDGAAAEALSMGRYEQMRLNQQGFQPPATDTLPVAGSAVLPSWPPTMGSTAPSAPSQAAPAAAPANSAAPLRQP